LQRIALFDHFMSGKCLRQNACGVLGGRSPCDHINKVVLPQIRSNPDHTKWPVIENYRTSAVTTSWVAGCINRELNKKTVFVELTPWYYSNWFTGLPKKHTVGISMYLHSLKWKDKGPVQDGAPSARMPTAELKAMCPATPQKPNCPKYFQQKAGGKTTWDYDDRFRQKQWSGEVPAEPVDEPASWTLVLTAKDLVIWVLVVINVVAIVVLCFVCSKAKGGKRRRYQVVRMKDSDMESEEVAV